MRTRYEHHGISWIDLESPSRDEVQDLVNEFNIMPLIAEELLLPSTKPRVELDTNYIYLVLHFPALRHSHRTREQEIDFIIGKNFLVTTHYDTIDPLHKFSKLFEVNSMLDKSNLGDNAGYVFFYMVRNLYRAVEHEVEYVKHELSVTEDHIFTGHEVEMVSAISRSARDLLNLRQGVEPHREVLHEFETIAPHFFGEEYARYARALNDEYYRVHNHIMRETESLHELRETNNSLLTTKQNETMKVLTVIAAVMLPLSFTAELFSMDTKSMPIIGRPHDFLIVICIMILVALSLFSFFKLKKWI